MTAKSVDAQKRSAAKAAFDFVRPGMKLGLGSGSTAAHFVDLLAEKVRQGFHVIGVPTSEQTRRQALEGGVRLAELDDLLQLDLTVDGTDEFDDALRLVKGGGGALLREKIVAAASDRLVIIADAGKHVARLGAFPLPVEIDRFGAKSTTRRLTEATRALGLNGTIAARPRKDGALFVSDGGHYILDCAFGAIPEPEALAAALDATPGVVEHGLFIGMATTVLVAGVEGVRRMGVAAST